MPAAVGSRVRSRDSPGGSSAAATPRARPNSVQASVTFTDRSAVAGSSYSTPSAGFGSSSVTVVLLQVGPTLPSPQPDPPTTPGESASESGDVAGRDDPESGDVAVSDAGGAEAP